MKQSDEFLIKSGKCFSRPIITFGYIIIVLGAITTYRLLSRDEPMLSIVGIIPILFGSFLSFNKSGFQIKDKKYRTFCYFFKWKIGKWQEAKLPYVTILKKRMATKTYGGRTMVSSSEINVVFEITLLSESHRTKQPILRFNSKEDATSTLESISKLLEVEVCQYNPQTTRRR